LDIGAIWDLIILSPMINILVVVSKFLFHNLGLSIIAFTIVVRGILYPINRKQMMATKKMQDVQPKLAELQKKYARDRQKLAQEQMSLYKQAGISPLGCVVPMIIQLPIWMALYQAIMRVMATGPEQLLSLSRHLYSSWDQVFALVPLNSQFLWINLGLADPYFILPLLVGVTMWIQQKMTTPAFTDPQQQSQNQMMLWMMPILFTFMSVTFASGLALYWLVSNIISVIMQYFISGWGPLGTMFKKKPPATVKQPAKR
jgi:YidC/Oxa1 family membrane protein insertase